MPVRGARLLAIGCALAGCATAPPVPSGDADFIAAPLSAQPGDAARGRAIVTGRDANCLLCHALPMAAPRVAGDLAPPLDGVGARLGIGQLRLRVVDSRRLNPRTIMPAYHSIDGLNQVGAAWRGKPILSAQQVEDVVAYLATLR